MHIIQRVELVSGRAAKVEIALRGSGDPNDEHEIIAVRVLDDNDERIYCIGEPVKAGAPFVSASKI